MVVVNGVGDFEEVAAGEGEAFGEAAVAVLDAEDGAVAAVLGQATATHVAAQAHAVDHPHHALAEKLLRGLGPDLLDNADKLVPRNHWRLTIALTVFISPKQRRAGVAFQIAGTNASMNAA